MSVIQNAVPKAYMQGIQDQTAQVNPAVPQQVSSHCALVPLFLQRGTTEPTLCDGIAINTLFGSASFDSRQPYFNHQSIMAQTILGQGNQLFVARILPPDAQLAILRLSVEIIANPAVPVYQRSASGQFILGSNGLPQPLLNATTSAPITVAGVNLVWHANLIPIVAPATTAAQMFGQGAQSVGLLTITGSSNKSTVYPIMDLLVGSYGAFGNNVGLRLSAPNALSSQPGNVSLMQQIKQYLYRFQFVELMPNSVMPVITLSQKGALSLDLCLAQNVVDPNLGTTVSVYDGLIPAYQNMQPVAGPKIDAPFNQLYIYASNIAAVQQLMFTSEATALAGDTTTTSGFGWIPIDYTNASNSGLMNILTATDFNGNPYQSIQVTAPANGDITATSMDNNLIAVHYATGGADGTLTLANYDKLVNAYMSQFGSYIGPDGNFWPLLDDARYPFGIIYDSGFSIATKKTLLVPMGARKDISSVLSAHYLGNWDATMTTWTPQTTQLTLAQEQSVGYALKVAAQMYPESTVYGTPTVRCAIFAHSGKLIQAPQYGYLPLTIEVASKFAAAMSAAGGAWKQSALPDLPRSTNNHVQLFMNVNNTWQSDANYATDWADAINTVQSFDMGSLFFPAWRTVYPDDTSILTSMFAMIAGAYLEKVAKNSWRSLTGTSGLTDAQLIKDSNDLITEACNGAFANRFVITPSTTITQDDQARGYSWTTNIYMAGDNMKTAGSFTITSQRLSALPTTTA